MAEHFLDTETRHEVPTTALCCLEAGMTVAEAREAWACEVSPVVGGNLFLVAGEWAGWDPEWLVSRITAVRARRARWPRIVRAASQRLSKARFLDGDWTATARCMELLSKEPAGPAREQRARDLGVHARHVFDFVPLPLAGLRSDERARIALLWPEIAHATLWPALLSSEHGAAERRVEQALAGYSMR